jgi:hypothetical protein
VNKLEMKEFLCREWEEFKESKITLLGNITDFFKREFPEIKIDSDIVKHFAIESFIHSGSFASTHSAILKLKLQRLYC